jgi:hypothetical protein
MDELTEEQQQFLDELNDFTRNVVLRMDIPGQKQFLDSAMAAVQETTPTTIAPGDLAPGDPTTTTIAPADGTATNVQIPTYTGSDTPLDTDYFQPALGVSGGRQVSKITGVPVAGTYTGFKPVFTPTRGERISGQTQVAPKYFNGDEDLINTFTREEVATVQQQMKAAGILGKYRLGVVDDATLAAFKTVLGQANRTASDWTVGLKALQSGATGGPGLTYRISNPDDLNKVIEQSAKYVLGRSIDPAMSQRIAKAYQQLQIEEQRANQRGGVQTQAPQADVFAAQQIKQKSGAEADAYKFAQYAQAILGGPNG